MTTAAKEQTHCGFATRKEASRQDAGACAAEGRGHAKLRKLDIIVPHAGEPWEICRKFFDMLRLQLVADFSQVKIIVVHDNCPEWPEKRLRGLPVAVEQHCVQSDHPGKNGHTGPRRAGVSIARNYGLKCSQAEWVMFCDCDDMFANVWALHSILDGLSQPAADRNDLLWMKFYVEQDRGRRVTGMNWVFIHGKIYRREFLLRHGLRFCPRLYYAEDSAFNATVSMDIDPQRIGELQCDAVPYVWVWNRESVTSRKENRARNILGLYDRHTVVAEEYRKRGRPRDAAATLARVIWDGYYQCHRKDLPSEDMARIWGKVARHYLEHKDEIQTAPEELMATIRASSQKEAAEKGLPTPPEDGFPEWLRLLEKRYGGGGNNVHSQQLHD